jgi:hypothetical protein
MLEDVATALGIIFAVMGILVTLAIGVAQMGQTERVLTQLNNFLFDWRAETIDRFARLDDLIRERRTGR